METDWSRVGNPVEYHGETPSALNGRGWAGPGWYYWNFAFTILYGPYTNEEEARASWLKSVACPLNRR